MTREERDAARTLQQQDEQTERDEGEVGHFVRNPSQHALEQA